MIKVIKNTIQSDGVLYWLPLLDLLFCGKATAVATVHRTVAKSRLSSPTNKVRKKANKNTTQMGGVFGSPCWT